MRGRWLARGLKILVFVAVAVALMGFIVMRLWNWLTPELFGWHVITYWQALGILLLCKILFGGFRGRGGPGFGRGEHWRSRMIERWVQMTPEEREKFLQGMRGGWGGGCGPFSSPSAPSSNPAPKP